MFGTCNIYEWLRWIWYTCINNTKEAELFKTKDGEKRTSIQAESKLAYQDRNTLNDHKFDFWLGEYDVKKNESEKYG